VINPIAGATSTNSLPVFVGLDYHDATVQVCILDSDCSQLANRDCATDWQAIAGFVQRFQRPVRAALEGCRGAADLAEELVSRAGWSVDLAHPGYVARMKQNPDKTDYQDARLLADLERVGYLPKVWLAPHYIREPRHLVRYRQPLANQRRATKLAGARLAPRVALPARRGGQPLDADLAALAAARGAVERAGPLAGRPAPGRTGSSGPAAPRGRAAAGAADGGRPDVQRLRQQAGIGGVTAWTLRAEVGRFDRFRSGKQLARCCGLSPRNASNGQRQADAGLIHAANPQLRTVLIETAHRLVRYDPHWQTFHQRLRAASKPGSVVAWAVESRDAGAGGGTAAGPENAVPVPGPKEFERGVERNQGNAATAIPCWYGRARADPGLQARL